MKGSRHCKTNTPEGWPPPAECVGHRHAPGRTRLCVCAKARQYSHSRRKLPEKSKREVPAIGNFQTKRTATADLHSSAARTACFSSRRESATSHVVMSVVAWLVPMVATPCHAGRLSPVAASAERRREVRASLGGMLPGGVTGTKPRRRPASSAGIPSRCR